MIGTWDLTTTPIGSSAGIVSTVVVGEDSLTITSPGFNLTASRASNVLTFVDNQGGGDSSTLTGTQTSGAFNSGIVPFDLGGAWAILAGATGSSSPGSCSLSVTSGEIDGSCDGWFSFTSSLNATAQPTASSFGDFGGSWNNSWTWDPDGGPYPCQLQFGGNDINTCDGGAANGEVTENPLAGITFTWDGANTISGSAQGWAEFSATRQ